MESHVCSMVGVSQLSHFLANQVSYSLHILLKSHMTIYLYLIVVFTLK